jgi:hypothetical protein
MQPIRIAGAHAVIGKEQGYAGLPVRVDITTHGRTLVSAWEPTAAELLAMVNGAPVYLHVLTDGGHPPVMLTVGAPSAG